MVKIGNTEITDVKLGSTQVDEIYLGSTQIWGGGSPTPVLPYDAEVEYLQSDGSQYIDADVILTKNCVITADVAVISGSNYPTVLGAVSANNAFSCPLVYNNAGHPYIQLGNRYAYLYTTSKFGSSLIHYTLTSDGSNQYISDGENTSSESLGKSLSSLSLYIFARHRYDTVVGNYAVAKIGKVRIVIDGVLQRDFIPVRVGQVGYLYDKVSRRCFGNLGTGSFVVGADKGVLPYDAQVEYLEANGSQWLSTGITYQNGIRVTCEAQYTGDYDKTQIIFAPSASAGLWVGNVPTKKWALRNSTGSTYGDSSVKTKVSVEYGSNTRKLYINDVLKDTYSKDTTSTNPIAVLNSYDGTFCSKAKLWWIQITDSNNQLLFDGIPVRAGQVGYLYDRVSGQLFGNSGTGSFVLGNDVTT